MNFSSSLMTSMGISLGGLELATDYLFANPELYEPELNEIKTTISKKPQSTLVKNVKAVKPKITKESIISKFDILQDKPSIITDEIILTNTVVSDSDDFDFSFDDERKTQSEILEEIDSLEDEQNSALLEATLLMQRLTAGNSELTEDFEEDNTIENEDDGFDIDIEEDEENGIDIDEDDIFIEDEEDIFVEGEEDEPEDDALEINDNLFDLEDDSEDGDDTFDIEDDSEDGDDTFDIEDESEDGDDTFDIEDDEDEYIEDTKVKPNINESSIKTKEDNNVANSDVSTTTKEDKAEIEHLRAQIASLNEEVRKIHSINATKNTSELKGVDIKNDKDDEVDALIKNVTHSKKPRELASEDKYSVMSTEQLYKYVRHFMLKMGVDKRPVDLAVLNKEFGDKNVKKLITKSYLIKIGKGVTIGR